MDFTGHKLIIINSSWVFDMTEYIGYKTKVSRGVVKEYTRAFTVDESDEGVLTFNKERNMKIPIYILKSVEKIIKNYRKELENE